MIDAEAHFETLMARLQGGDSVAAEQIVRHYESYVRRAVRTGLRSSHLRRTFDSVDFCQSVFAAFFYQIATGTIEIASQEHLVALLVTITRRKLAGAFRKESRLKRRPQGNSLAVGRFTIVDPAPTPSEIASSKELAERIRQSLTAEERLLADLRVAGRSWNEIGLQMGGSAQSCRVQLFRAIRRVLGELGISGHDS